MMASTDTNNTNTNHIHENHKYKLNFFTELYSLYKSQLLTDVSLVCGAETSIRCHKIVLSAFSPYFRAMFSSGFMEAELNEIQMPATDRQTLNSIVEYAYTGIIELTFKNIQNVFSLASLLQLPELIEACCDYMNVNLDSSNALDVLQFARNHQVESLMRNAIHFVTKNISDILETQEFLAVDEKELIIEIFSSDSLNVSSESIVLDAIVKWTNGNEMRETVFEKLFFSCVRIGLVDIDWLRKFYRVNFTLISTSLNCVNLIEERLSGVEVETRPRCRKSADNLFLIIGGNCDLDDGIYVNCFEPHTGAKFIMSRDFQEKSNRLKNGYFHVENPGVCETDEGTRVWVAGGNYVYHEYKCTRKEQKTGYTSSNELDDFVDGEEMLSKELFEFDSKNDTWIKRSSMLFAKANFSLCSMDEKIYAFGGITVDQEQLDIVEVYDMPSNSWTYIGVMPNKFIAGCVVRYEDCFYVMGGRSGVGRFDNCYKFIPATNEWTEIRRMNIGRFNFGACVIENKIYVFGGQRYNEDSSYYTREALDSVEVYDIETQEWRLIEAMPAPLYNTAVCRYTENTVYLTGTTECKFSGNTLIGFMFTSVFRLQWTERGNLKWAVVEHEVSDIKSNYRCVAARFNTDKLYKCATDLN